MFWLGDCLELSLTTLAENKLMMDIRYASNLADHISGVAPLLLCCGPLLKKLVQNKNKMKFGWYNCIQKLSAYIKFAVALFCFVSIRINYLTSDFQGTCTAYNRNDEMAGQIRETNRLPWFPHWLRECWSPTHFVRVTFGGGYWAEYMASLHVANWLKLGARRMQDCKVITGVIIRKLLFCQKYVPDRLVYNQSV